MTARMKITGIIFSIPICMHAQTYSLTIANNAAQEGQQCHEEWSAVKRFEIGTANLLHFQHRVPQSLFSTFIYGLTFSNPFSSLVFFPQYDSSAQGGSPSSTLTCSTASPCSESPSSTLSTSAGGQSLPQPLPLPSPHCGSSSSPSGTLSSPASSPAPCPPCGLMTGSSPGPPSQSPTSTLESKDSGIIGESCCCCSVSPDGICSYYRTSNCVFFSSSSFFFTHSDARPTQMPSRASSEV